MRGSAIAVVVAIALTSCSGDDDGGGASQDQSLRPQFAPTTTTPVATGEAPTTTTTPTPVTDPSVATPGASTSVPPGATSAAITDPGFDTTSSPLDPPPAWADLVGARLTRATGGFELRVRLRGGDAPESTDDAHTMNIATFYDVDGDGVVDYEVWANIASGGWGASYFDDTGRTKGGFQEGSGVAVAPEGDEVVLRFPLTHLASAERFRWSVASEWGRYELIGTDAMVRDDMPDADRAADFPAP